MVLAGLGMGALIGVLYAPKAGRETREDIANSALDAKQRAAELVEQSAAELACVTAHRDRRPLSALRFGMQHVAGSKRGPAWLELDSKRTPVEMDRLDERRGPVGLTRSSPRGRRPGPSTARVAPARPRQP